MSFLKKISPSAFTDKELAELYKKSGNLSVLGQLYERYMDLLYGVCLKYLKDPEDAKDSVMMIFEELVPKLKKHNVEHFRSWVYQLARNHCLMKLRSGKKLKTTEMDPDLMQTQENTHLNGVLEKEEHLENMEICLRKLPAEQRKVIQLFYLEGKCYNEIAAITGYSWNEVRSFIQNGRRNLKLCMEKRMRAAGNREPGAA